MKRTNEKTMFVTLEQAWDEFELHFDLYDEKTKRDIPCEILQAEFIRHDDENNTDWFLIEIMSPEVEES